jgi:hypothetical protein
MNYIKSPRIGSIVTHNGWGYNLKNPEDYPCDVYIESGTYLSNGRLSNYWWWRKVLKDNTLGELEGGYGDFSESENEYDIKIIITQIKSERKTKKELPMLPI